MDRKIIDRIFRVPQDYQKSPKHPTEGREPFYNRVVIPAIRTMMDAQGTKIDIRGSENIPAEGGAMLAFNHTGYYDFIYGGIAGYLKGRRLVRFMAKKSVFDAKIVGTMMRKMKHIPVDRERGAGSVDEAVNRLRAGQLVGIFPEATISESFELKEFKNGAVRIAHAAGVQMIPCVIWGSQRVMSKGPKRHLHRAHIPIYLRIGKPMDTTGDAQADTDALWKVMRSMLDEAQAEYEQEYGPFAGGEDWRPAALGGGAPTLEEARRRSEERKAARKKK